MTAFFSLALHELKLRLRDPGGLVMLFFMPAVFIVVLSVSLQGAFSSELAEARLKLAVVDEDGSEGAARLTQQLALAGIFREVRLSGAAARAEGLAALAAGAVDVLVVLPKGTGAALDFDQDAQVEVLLDPVVASEVAHAAEGAVRGVVLKQLVLDLNDRIAEMMGKDPAEAPALKLTVARRYAQSDGARLRVNAVQQNVPGWTIFALFWIGQVLALNLLEERTSGVSQRLRAAPVSIATRLAGKVTPFFLINLAQAAFTFAVGVWVLPLLGCPQLALGEPVGLALVTAAISCAAIGLGLLMASLSRSPVLVASATAALLVVMAVVGGIMVPKFVMPDAMRTLSWVVPHGWALDGYHKLLVRGLPTKSVLPNLGALLGFAAVFYAVAAVRLRPKER